MCLSPAGYRWPALITGIERGVEYRVLQSTALGLGQRAWETDK